MRPRFAESRASVILTLWAFGSAGFAGAVAPPPQTAATPRASAPAKSSGVRQLDWDELLPEAERDSFTSTPPPPIHDYLGERAPAIAQSGSTAVNQALDGKTIKLPGFVVPLTVSADGVVSEFLLVPYVGACIHVPPPPPNQIVYVRMSPGLQIHSLYDAFWITGKMHARRERSPWAIAVYSLDGVEADLYKY